MSSLQYFPRNPASVGRSPYAAATLYLFALAVEGPEPVLLILWRPLREETTGTPCTPRYPGGGGIRPGANFVPDLELHPPCYPPVTGRMSGSFLLSRSQSCLFLVLYFCVLYTYHIV